MNKERQISNTKKLPKNFLVFIFHNAKQEDVTKMAQSLRENNGFVFCSGVSILYQKSEWTLMEA